MEVRKAMIKNPVTVGLDTSITGSQLLYVD